MNKYQRKKSKRIKKLQREMPFITYTEAKRLDRKIMRSGKQLADTVHQLGRSCRGFARGISEVAVSLAKLRNTLGGGYIIDETPDDYIPELWPKENPHMKKEAAE